MTIASLTAAATALVLFGSNGQPPSPTEIVAKINEIIVAVNTGGGGGGTPGGSTTQVQYNNAGAFGGITGATTNGTALTLVSPVLGTPASGLLTNCTGLPISTGVSGLGTGVATFLATPSSANLLAAVTDETGTGALVFANTPTIVTPVISASLPNTTALTVSGQSLTGANAQSLIDITGTWNTSGTPTAIKLNVTNTASNFLSLLVDLQGSGVSKFNLRADGFGTFANGMATGAGNLVLNSLSLVSWNAGDAVLGRQAAGVIRLGFQDAAAPVAQALTVQSVVAGTSNTPGVNFAINGSIGTGTGAGGSLVFQTAPAGSTGTAQNTLTVALTIASDLGATFAGKITGNAGVTVGSGQVLKLGNAATTGLSAGVLAALTNASIVITDSTGQAYRIPCTI